MERLVVNQMVLGMSLVDDRLIKDKSNVIEDISTRETGYRSLR